MTTMYGISNCDTVRKAKKWLTEQNIDFTFHDYRKDGITAQWLETVVRELDWQVLLNKRGTTFRQLSEAEKHNIDETKAVALMLKYPAMIKRPILHVEQSYTCGFSVEQYNKVFAQ